MPILYLALMFSTISSYVGGIYIAHMKSKEIGITTTLAAITNLLINVLTVKFIGIYAASLSTLISYFWLAIYRMHDVQKIQKIKFNYKRIAILLIALALISFACFLRITVVDVINMVVSIVLAFALNREMIHLVIKMMCSRFKEKMK